MLRLYTDSHRCVDKLVTRVHMEVCNSLWITLLTFFTHNKSIRAKYLLIFLIIERSRYLCCAICSLGTQLCIILLFE